MRVGRGAGADPAKILSGLNRNFVLGYKCNKLAY